MSGFVVGIHAPTLYELEVPSTEYREKAKNFRLTIEKQELLTAEIAENCRGVRGGKLNKAASQADLLDVFHGQK
jgi:hypothetical protein